MTEVQTINATAGDDSAELMVITPWQYPDPAIDEPGVEELDAARDFLFRVRVLQVLNEQAPWLVPIIRAAGARIAAYPGKFYVVLDNASTTVEVPVLGTLLHLLPWTDSNETAH